MSKLVVMFVLFIGFLPSGVAQDQDAPPNPEMQRQEITNLEHEAARAVQLNNGTFFRRVYSDDFTGTLSNGQVVNKTKYIAGVQESPLKYNFVNVTDIAVHLYQETAVVTCQWASSGTFMGKAFGVRIRITHVYINGQRGWQVVASQETLLPVGVLAH